ncbi:hypothetical protein IMZ11_12995 [Microtetraspora sp. AC03309]|uniref:hypothetical protein n=1 Tax=Microtetraspora sp. AC03309 TaxID=2779376 RepID=UPI001E2DEA66|nr:hypothetical protein [Microtetraspora sp. AC03309]MCC5576547.1 hypothetical protein [Microtetraspora sp. AC03309]
MATVPQENAQGVRPPATTAKRRLGCLAAIVMPFLLLFVLISMPQWLHNRELDGLADRFQSYPLPPDTEFSDQEVQMSVALRGNSNHCDYRLRFNLQTKLPVSEVVRHYGAAKIGIEGGWVEIIGWTPSKTPSFPLAFDQRQPIIVEIQDNLHDPSWDFRCW